MSYIVLDLEWNQAMSSHSSVFNKLPIYLAGEIIEIGAVKLTDDFKPGEEFTADIKPVYFRKLHRQVKKITGFDEDRLTSAQSFRPVFKRFREWCGEGAVFLTWGADDQRIMEQNIIVHDEDWDWIDDWINLQMLFNLQTGGAKEQKSLASAMEYFSIEQTRTAHDALGDAYNTALVCSFLDMKEGLRVYPDIGRILAERYERSKTQSMAAESGALFAAMYENIPSKAVAFSKQEIEVIDCPVCGKALSGNKWLTAGESKYINIFTCPDDGKFIARLRFKKEYDNNLWMVRQFVYHAESEDLEEYRENLNRTRRRGRHRKKSGSGK